MSKKGLKECLEEARKMIEENGTHCGYAKAFGYLETAVDSYLGGGEGNAKQTTSKK